MLTILACRFDWVLFACSGVSAVWMSAHRPGFLSIGSSRSAHLPDPPPLRGGRSVTNSTWGGASFFSALLISTLLLFDGHERLRNRTAVHHALRVGVAPVPSFFWTGWG